MEKPSKDRSETPPPLPDAGNEHDRPTVNPPFDVEAFARAASSPSGQPRARSDAPTDRPTNAPLDPEFPMLGGETPGQSHPPANPNWLTASALSIANARAPSSANVKIVQDSTGDAEPASSIEAAVLSAIGSSSAPEITERMIEDPVAEMRERFSLGDYTGALEMSELILTGEPGHADAADCGRSCRTVLENMYAARLGPLDRVPVVVVHRTQMRWLSMDHRAGFVLSLIDGSSSVEMILDVSGMPKLDALRTLHELVQQKIVSFR